MDETDKCAPASRKLLKEFLVSQKEVREDKLTGLKNRKGWNDVLRDAAKKALRNQGKFSILFFDVIKFKNINETYGHLIGDKVVGKIGENLRYLVRDTDTPGRFGGDEFVILLFNTDIDGAKKVAEKLEEGMNLTIKDINDESFNIDVRFKIGMSQWEPVEKEEAEKLRGDEYEKFIGKRLENMINEADVKGKSE